MKFLGITSVSHKEEGLYPMKRRERVTLNLTKQRAYVL
jgi:hypothetical protein